MPVEGKQVKTVMRIEVIDCPLMVHKQGAVKQHG